MLDALQWLITVEIIGLAAFPLAFCLLPRLADRGFTLGKPLGILLVSYLFWVLGLAHIPTAQPTAIALVLLLAAASAYLTYRHRDDLRGFIVREWRTLAVAEAIFLVFFVGWALFRASDPFINHTEQPMDLALLSASMNSVVGQPEDPWLRGESVSYYYFGYWMMGAVSQIAAVQSNISYNLAMALIPAMAAAGIFGLVVNMARLNTAFHILAKPGASHPANSDRPHSDTDSVDDDDTDDEDAGGVSANGDDESPENAAPARASSGDESSSAINPATNADESQNGAAAASHSVTPSDSAHKNTNLAIVAGVIATVLLGVVSNLEGVLEFMRLNGMGTQGLYDWIRISGVDGPNEMPPVGWAPTEHWWWFHASRVINTFDGMYFIDNTIQEFPFFSFMLGDMHPHVMSIPFIALFVGISLNFYRLPSCFWREYRSVYPYAIILTAAIVLGGLGFNNLWDMPTFAALLIGVLALTAYREGNGVWQSFGSAIFPVGLAIVALAVLMYSPYLLNIDATVEGIGVVVTHTRAIHMFIVWGLFLTAVAPFLLTTFWQTTVQRDWAAQGITALALAFVPWLLWSLAYLPSDGSVGEAVARFFGILPLTALAAIGVYNALNLARQERKGGRLFATLLAVLGLGLIIGAEFLFIRDFFNNRGNTVFKLYYQAWILLSAASAFAVYYWMRTIRRRMGWGRFFAYIWAAAFVALLLGSLYYPLAGIKTKPETPSFGLTLDGLEFVRQYNPAEYAAIDWLKQNAPPDAAIVEAVGEWGDWALVSRSTGLPTIVNWLGHQRQWRGGWERFDADSADVSRALRDQYFDERAAEVERIYATLDPAEAQLILYKYNIDYVYIGHRERELYGTEGMAKFEAIAERVFASPNGDSLIYRVR
ncbi:MAG: DUF2298 domain-containing protein [Chloroflexi bacterium]|nr:DUF2298 domain-containing protein [Chloroflexota bacterium]